MVRTLIRGTSAADSLAGGDGDAVVLAVGLGGEGDGDVAEVAGLDALADTRLDLVVASCS